MGFRDFECGKCHKNTALDPGGTCESCEYDEHCKAPDFGPSSYKFVQVDDLNQDQLKLLVSAICEHLSLHIYLHKNGSVSVGSYANQED